MSEEIGYNRRRLFGAAAMTIAAAQFGTVGTAKAQSSKTAPPSHDLLPRVPGHSA